MTESPSWLRPFPKEAMMTRYVSHQDDQFRKPADNFPGSGRTRRGVTGPNSLRRIFVCILNILILLTIGACQGPMGPMGLPGSPGEQGEKGNTGNTGNTGLPGLNGKDGISLVWKGAYKNQTKVEELGPPQNGWAYYNEDNKASYIYYNGWQLIARDGEDGAKGDPGVSLVWKGAYDADTDPALVSPQDGWAYYNTTDGNSYIYGGLPGYKDWYILAGKGDPGLVWQGAYKNKDVDELKNPKPGWAYYNTTDNRSYIYYNNQWNVFAYSLHWKGGPYASETDPALANPQDGWVYRNTNGICYIYNNQTWNEFTHDGTNGTDGVSIVWQGAYKNNDVDELKNPKPGWAYYNTTDENSYIYGGDPVGWYILAKKGGPGLTKVYDSAATPKFIGYAIGTGNEGQHGEEYVIHIIRPVKVDNKERLYFFKLNWNGQIALESSPGSFLYDSGLDYGMETYIPYRVFGSKAVSNPAVSLYTFNEYTTAGLGAGTSQTNYSGYAKDAFGVAYTAASSVAPLYKVKQLTGWSAIDPDMTDPVGPLRLELPK
ncbi:hypothetical protein LQZ21_04680 [Treponema sp. TIM-1]|uniref:hypothetical protein n=1 Tax=Treponema sp. TIM-1 TaxID=2898417 RepID=UPI00397F9BB9